MQIGRAVILCIIFAGHFVSCRPFVDTIVHFRRVSQSAKSGNQFRHVCPSAFGSHWTDFFMKFDIWEFFTNFSRKLKFN